MLVYQRVPSNIGVQLAVTGHAFSGTIEADDPRELSWRGTFGKHTKSELEHGHLQLIYPSKMMMFHSYITILVYQRVTVGDFPVFFPEKCE